MWRIRPIDFYLVPELLDHLHGHCQEDQNLVDPGDDAFGLVAVELGDALLVDDVVDAKDQLEALQVEAQSQL